MHRAAPLLLLLGCTEPATQLVVSVGTDYLVPDELSRVDAHTERVVGGQSSGVHSYDVGTIGMPFSFGVAPKEGDEELEIFLVVEGFSAQGLLVRSIARTGFIEHRTLNIPVFLSKRCSGVECAEGETCEDGACVSAHRPPDDLNPYDPKLDPNVQPPPPRPDGGTPPPDDAGTPPEEDGGQPDGGLPDTGAPQDTGVPPDPCSVSAPVELATADLAFDPTLDLVAADLDGDGVIEFAAAGSQTSASPLAVLDFDACDAPVVTASTAWGELRQGLLFSGALFAVERTKISRWQYSGPNQLEERQHAVARAGEIERLAFARQGGSALAVADLGASGWSYVTFDPTIGFIISAEAPERPRGFSAELTGRYLHGDDLALRAILPGTPAMNVLTLALVRDPIITGEEDGSRLIAARAGTDGIVVARWTNGLGNSTVVDFGARVVAGPILAPDGGDAARFYVLLENGTLTGCGADLDDPTCQIFTSTRQFPLDEIDGERSLLTAWVDDDFSPDVVFVSRRGKVFFLSGDELASDAAPMIDLGQDARGGAAIADDFFEAFQRPGHLLVVPHDRKLSLVAWRGRQGSDDALWPQHRRDARRSARSP